MICFKLLILLPFMLLSVSLSDIFWIRVFGRQIILLFFIWPNLFKLWFYFAFSIRWTLKWKLFHITFLLDVLNNILWILSHDKFFNKFILYLIELIFIFLNKPFWCNFKSLAFTELKFIVTILYDLSYLPPFHYFFERPLLSLQKHSVIMICIAVSKYASFVFVLRKVLLVKRILDVDFFLVHVIVDVL